jgi:hypothetical protein
VLDAAVAASLQHRQMAGQIAALIGERIVDRVANPGLGGQMHDPLGTRRLHQLQQGLVLGDVHPDHREARSAFQPGGAGRL